MDDLERLFLSNPIRTAVWIFGTLVVVVLTGAILDMIVRRLKKRKTEARHAEIYRIFQNKVSEIAKAGSLSQISGAPVILEKGEGAFWYESSSLFEMRSARSSGMAGASVRIANGLYIHQGIGNSRSYDEWRLIASGNLVVTNKRIIFDGAGNDRTVKIKDIIACTGEAELVEISTSKRQKSMLFSSSNGYLAEWMIKHMPRD